ncbi:MAG: hypothetical protein RLZZ458_2085 [Planctomycetota bacterium]
MPQPLLCAIRLSTVALLLQFGALAVAQIPPAAATPGVWNCAKGDNFTAVVETTRTTTIIVNGEPQPARQSTDLMQLYYIFGDTLPGGDAIVLVRITSARCDVQQQHSPDAVSSGRGQGSVDDIQRKLVRLPPFQLQVTPEGHIRPGPGHQHNSLIQTLAGNDASIAALLSKSCPDELYTSWFGRPFWFPKLELLTAENTQPWTASCTDSCGPFGVLQTEINLQRLLPQDGFAFCSLNGTPRFVPLVLAAAKPSEIPQIPLPVTAVAVKSSSFSGAARIRFNQPADLLEEAPDDLPQPLRPDDSNLNPNSGRKPQISPPFQSLETTLTISGSGTPGEALQRTLNSNEFQFEYSHRCRFVITGYSFRANDRIKALPRLPQ